MKLEKKLEYALREDGFTENSIKENRIYWRREAFIQPKRERFISTTTLKLIKEIRKSPAYERIVRAVSRGNLHLVKSNRVGPFSGPTPAAQNLSYSVFLIY